MECAALFGSCMNQWFWRNQVTEWFINALIKTHEVTCCQLLEKQCLQNKSLVLQWRKHLKTFIENTFWIFNKAVTFVWNWSSSTVVSPLQWKSQKELLILAKEGLGGKSGIGYCFLWSHRGVSICRKSET